MRWLIAISMSALLLSGAAAQAQEYSRSVKLSKGKAKVEFTAAPAEAAPSKSARNPRVGIAPSPSSSFGNFVARKLDDAGKVVVVPSSQLRSALALSGGFDQLMRSELTGLIAAACKEGRLDYLLLMGAPQTSAKTDITAMLFFVGRARMRNRQESRLYDCRVRQTVWVQNVLLETSQGVVSAGFGGVGAGLLGGPEAEQAMAGIYAQKLAADMGW